MMHAGSKYATQELHEAHDTIEIYSTLAHELKEARISKSEKDRLLSESVVQSDRLKHVRAAVGKELCIIS